MRLAALALCLLPSRSPARPVVLPAPVPTGFEIVQQMRQKYDGKWYRTATFVQKTTKGDGSVETWYEALQIPGMLRIDIAPLDSGKAIFFRADSIYVVEGGKIKNSGPFVHPLMILGFDIYSDPAERTSGRLTALGIDLNRVSEGTWKGRPSWIVGATAGDTTSKQFWIDKERLVFVRMLETTPKGKRVETVFDGYQQLGGGWIETLVDFSVDGVSKQKEEYSSPHADVKLPGALFDPAKFIKAEWIGTGKP